MFALQRRREDALHGRPRIAKIRRRRKSKKVPTPFCLLDQKQKFCIEDAISVVRISSTPLIESYRERIAKVHRELGISPDYETVRNLVPQVEATELCSVGFDMYGRERFLIGEAVEAWDGMQKRARESGIELILFSAFRSVEYQRDLIVKELAKPRALDEVLRVLAAPGYSEHHTGRAVDLTTTEMPPLREEFESTPAFQWLMTHAQEFRFSLSFPRGNRYGFIYEPWHWAYAAQEPVCTYNGIQS